MIRFLVSTCNKMTIKLNEKYLTDQEGNKIAVVLDIQTYQQLLEELNQFRNIAENQKIKNLENLLIEGLDSGKLISVTDEWLDNKKADLIKNITKKE